MKSNGKDHVKKKVLAQVTHYQLELIYIAAASIFYFEELFHREFFYYHKN
jgi:hypothetical protein